MMVRPTMGSYEAYVKNIPAGQQPMHPFAWHNLAVRQAYDAAPDHIKAEAIRLKNANEQSLEELLTMDDLEIHAPDLEPSGASTSETSITHESGGNTSKSKVGVSDSGFEVTAQKEMITVVKNAKLEEREKYVWKVILMPTFTKFASQSYRCIAGRADKTRVWCHQVYWLGDQRHGRWAAALS